MLRELSENEMEMVSGGYYSFLLIHIDAMPGANTGNVTFDAQVANTENLEWTVFGDLSAGLASGHIVRVSDDPADDCFSPPPEGFNSWSAYQQYLNGLGGAGDAGQTGAMLGGLIADVANGLDGCGVFGD